MSAEPLPIPLNSPPSATELVEAYWERAYRFAAMLSRSPQEAGDIAQEALVRAVASFERYDPARGSFESWLWAIVLNAARDAGRAAGRRRLLWERLRTQEWKRDIPIEDTAVQRLDDAAVLAAVRRLPTRARTVVALRFGAQLGYREIGQQLGISEGAALMATRRALALLRRDLSEEAFR